MMNMIKETSMAMLEKVGNVCVFDKGCLAYDKCLAAVCPNICSFLGQKTGAFGMDSFNNRLSFVDRWLKELKSCIHNGERHFSVLFGFTEGCVDFTQDVVIQICNGNRLEKYSEVYRMDVCIVKQDTCAEYFLRASLYQVDMEVSM